MCLFLAIVCLSKVGRFAVLVSLHICAASPFALERPCYGHLVGVFAGQCTALRGMPLLSCSEVLHL